MTHGKMSVPPLMHPFIRTGVGDGAGVTDHPLWPDLAKARDIHSRAPLHHYSNSAAGSLNLMANFTIAWRAIATPDSMLGCTMAIVYTLMYWHFGQHLAVDMSWNVISLAVVFPISQGIAMGFTRRETALVQLSVFLGNARSVFEAMFTWTVKKGDRWLRLIDCFEDPAVAREQVRSKVACQPQPRARQRQRAASAAWQVYQLYNELFIALITYFDLPRWSRARQAFRWGGSEQQQDLKAIAHEQRLLVDSVGSTVGSAVEVQ